MIGRAPRRAGTTERRRPLPSGSIDRLPAVPSHRSDWQGSTRRLRGIESTATILWLGSSLWIPPRQQAVCAGKEKRCRRLHLCLDLTRQELDVPLAKPSPPFHVFCHKWTTRERSAWEAMKTGHWGVRSVTRPRGCSGQTSAR